MKMTPKARAALEKVIARFEAGDLSPLVAVAGIKRHPPVPFDRWSYRNRVLAYAQTDSTDCRGYVQWQQAGRQVAKGTRAAFIWSPCRAKRTPSSEAEGADDTEDAPPRIYYKMTPVHPHTNTTGDQDYEPAAWNPPAPPPLHFSVYACDAETVQALSEGFHYLRVLLEAETRIPAAQLLAAHVRHVYSQRGNDTAWLERVAQELARLLKRDHDRLMGVLQAIKPEEEAKNG